MSLQDPGRPVDVLFAIDVTGSMSPIIDQVKANAKELMKKVYEGCAKAGKKLKDDGLRVKLLQFRDLPINEPMIDSGWTTRPDEFVAQIDSMTATGGGDEPESSLDAFVTACRSEWQPLGKAGKGRRIVILMTDASPHSLHASTRAEFAKGEPTAKDIDILKAAHDQADASDVQGYHPFRAIVIAPKNPRYEELGRLGYIKVVEASPGAGLAETNIEADIVPWIIESI